MPTAHSSLSDYVCTSISFAFISVPLPRSSLVNLFSFITVSGRTALSLSRLANLYVGDESPSRIAAIEVAVRIDVDELRLLFSAAAVASAAASFFLRWLSL